MLNLPAGPRTRTGGAGRIRTSRPCPRGSP